MGFIWNTKQNFLNSASHKPVICFGAGLQFNKFQKELEAEPVNIQFIWDNDLSKQGNTICCKNKDITICVPNIQMLADIEQYVILITCAKEKEIKKQLLSMGILEEQIFSYPFTECYPMHIQEQKKLRIDNPAKIILEQYLGEFGCSENQRKMYYNRIENKIQQSDSMVVPYMTVLVTSACTLNCRDCNNLMPYCTHSRFLESKTVIEDIGNIFNGGIDNCICMNITGGEPFLHKDLSKIIDTIENNDAILFAEIITNGTIIPQRKVLDSLKNSKFIVKISEYTGYTKKEELIDLLKKERIRFKINNNLSWVSSGGIKRRNKEKERITYEYLKCWAGKFCKSIWDGKLYACARAAFLHEIGVSDDISDYIDIKGSHLRERLQEFYLRDYIDACDFCDHMNLNGEEVEPAIQST